jgi:predicted flap endonuclease-1-like 5' DNA nuclease
MNWMDYNKTGDFWKAWQDNFKSATPTNNGADQMQAWWQQQEQFWKSTMDQTGKMFGNQPDLARQWQDMQSSFLKQWMDLSKSATERNPLMPNGDMSNYWKSFSDQSEKWFAEAFKDKLPEQLRPHFQTYYNMHRMFSSQWENIQGMVRNGLVEPKNVWQWINPNQYGEAIGKIMGFKPMGDLDEMTRQANRFFDQMRATVIKMIPATEDRLIEMNETFQKWSDKQTNDFFPFMHSMQELLKQNLEPYFQTAGQDTQADVLRQLKDLHFSYIAYLNHTHRMQRMVMDSGAQVLPEMMQEMRKKYSENQEIPVFDTFFKAYMDRLEHAIVEVMHTPEYTEVQNAVMQSGTTSKRIYDEMMELVLKDWPFLTKKEADELARETTILRRKVRDLETRYKHLAAQPQATTTAPATKATAKAAAVTPETNAAPELSDDILERIGKASAGIKDDLLEIKGIGEKLAEKLYELGIVSFEQMSRMDDYAYGLIDAMLPAFKGRAKRDEWAKQAKKLIKSKTTV